MGKGKGDFKEFNLATILLGDAAQIPQYFLLHK